MDAGEDKLAARKVQDNRLGHFFELEYFSLALL